MQNFLQIGSVGRGNYRRVYYGWDGEEIAELKDIS